MKKILILFCGGTIIMRKSGGSLMVDKTEDAINNLLKLEPRIKNLAELEVEYIGNIDSTNMKPEYWDKISEVIYKRYDDYDGFVITHGTDTMAYTSSALSFSLQGLGKPVVLTGAQIPGNRIESDARRNFINAVKLATMDISGVMVVFDEEIILGSRATKISESKLEAFETINHDLLGEIRVDINLNINRSKRHNKKIKLAKGFESNIGVIHLVPGMLASFLDKAIFSSKIKGLILLGYGTGNIGYEYLDVLKKAKQKKIPVIIDTQCLEGVTMMKAYDVGRQALKAGVIEAYDMTIETVATKLMWALKRAPYSQIKKIMHTNYSGEIDKQRKFIQ